MEHSLALYVYKIRKYYNDKYYKNNDPAHGLPHIDEVYANAVQILKESRYKECDPSLVALSVYLHDIFTNIDRLNHHTLVKEYVRNREDEFLKVLSDRDIRYVEYAVLEHRSSIVTPPSSLYSEVLRLADTGAPILERLLRRMWAYHYNDDMSDMDVAKLVLHHAYSKFGSCGYAYDDSIYKEYYRDDIDKFILQLDGLDEVGVIGICKGVV